MSDLTPGTWDFFQDAANGLIDSRMPHLLICGNDGVNFAMCSNFITDLNSLAWFRTQVEIYLNLLEVELSE